jgi:hypothetical protein
MMSIKMADCLVKDGTRFSKTSLCNPLYSAKLRIKRNIQADFVRYYATENQHKPWKKMVENRNIFPDFPIERVVANFRLIAGHNCLAAHLYRLSIYWFLVASWIASKKPTSFLIRHEKYVTEMGKVLNKIEKWWGFIHGVVIFPYAQIVRIFFSS